MVSFCVHFYLFKLSLKYNSRTVAALLVAQEIIRIRTIGAEKIVLLSKIDKSLK